VSHWKELGILSICYLLLNFYPSLAMNCHIVEFPDHREVICGGGAEPSNDGLKKSVRTVPAFKEQSPSGRPDRTENSSPAQDISISGIVALADVDRETANLRITCNVESKEQYDNLIVTVIGKDLRGAEKVAVPILGNALAGSITLFTGSGSYKSQDYHDVRTWEVKSMAIGEVVYSVISRESYGIKTYSPHQATIVNPATNAEANSKNIQIPVIVLEQKDGIITLPAKNGSIRFNHDQHQNRTGCSTCHGISTGRIPGFGKNIAHTVCKNCHATGRSGPTKCRECHKK